MEWYGEDFYNEPCELEEQMDIFKDSLMKSVKDEFIDEMEELKKEVKELQYVKNNFEDIKRDFELKKRELDYKSRDMERNIRKERLTTLLSDYQVIMYKATHRYEYEPKCDKCDKDGYVHYATPLGRDAKEECTCRVKHKVYYPIEYIRYEFSDRRNDNEVTAWYRQYTDDEDGFTYDTSIVAERIYNSDMNYSDLNTFYTFFKTKDECKQYCDWLNLKAMASPR